MIMPGIGTAIGAVAGGLLGGLSGGGEDDLEDIADLQKKVLGMTHSRNMKMMRGKMEESLGHGRATIAAGNLQETGSSKRYLGEVEASYLDEMNWQNIKTRMEMRAIDKGTSMQAEAMQNQGMQSMVSGIGDFAAGGGFGSYSKTGGAHGTGGYQKPTWMK
jgi:hypothetical protein